MRDGPQHDQPARGRVTDGVVDQVEQDPRDLSRPALDVGEGRRDDEAQIDA